MIVHVRSSNTRKEDRLNFCRRQIENIVQLQCDREREKNQ